MTHPSVGDELGHLGDIPLCVDVELARRSLPLREIVALEPGSLIRMQRSAGDNVDILMSGERVASGEIVVLEETVGVRLTDFREDG